MCPFYSVLVVVFKSPPPSFFSFFFSLKNNNKNCGLTFSGFSVLVPRLNQSFVPPVVICDNSVKLGSFSWQLYCFCCLCPFFSRVFMSVYRKETEHICNAFYITDFCFCFGLRSFRFVFSVAQSCLLLLTSNFFYYNYFVLIDWSLKVFHTVFFKVSEVAENRSLHVRHIIIAKGCCRDENEVRYGLARCINGLIWHEQRCVLLRDSLLMRKICTPGFTTSTNVYVLVSNVFCYFIVLWIRLQITVVRFVRKIPLGFPFSVSMPVCPFLLLPRLCIISSWNTCL